MDLKESKANGILPTLGRDNLELGTKALTRVVREVLEQAFKARLERLGGLVQSRCVDCGKKGERSPPSWEVV
ncbi:hypothetical protein J1N35_017816 [Gossypium stocksii]|uniref:Uncharacterized protein n=1 Tax=Gossypium stocksii TaxID=47602 RepID=A0A9D3VN72_9ROSI|nr:hypothetical protein J1N35_017816 [Gossypium stocksii]